MVKRIADMQNIQTIFAHFMSRKEKTSMNRKKIK